MNLSYTLPKKRIEKKKQRNLLEVYNHADKKQCFSFYFQVLPTTHISVKMWGVMGRGQSLSNNNNKKKTQQTKQKFAIMRKSNP